MSTDAITSLSLEVDDPNKRTDCKGVYKLTSVSEVDTFLSRFNHENNYTDGDTKLHVGDGIIIDFNSKRYYFFIAGFDLESDRIASDGTTYDNGYGIMLFPFYYNGNGYWNTENTIAGGYINSLAHYKVNELATTFKNDILGTHLVNRNVLLTNSIRTDGLAANGYTWTTAYSTLPSIGQIIGWFTTNNTIYDDGEANYKLPLLNYFGSYFNMSFWFRNIEEKENSNYRAYYLESPTNCIKSQTVNSNSYSYYSLFYIR